MGFCARSFAADKRFTENGTETDAGKITQGRAELVLRTAYVNQVVKTSKYDV